jgi:hypothetical protein
MLKNFLGEKQMEQRKSSAYLSRIESSFCEQYFTEFGKKIGFCERLRKVTPYRLLMGLVGTLSGGRVETIADIHRGFCEVTDKRVAYKPFHNQLSKESFPLIMRELVSRLLDKLSCKVLRIGEGSAFSKFKGIVIQDGTSFAIHEELREIFPGRFTTTHPAAVSLHTTLDLLKGEVTNVELTPDTTSEKRHVPDPKSLNKKLLLMDAGYFSLEYMKNLDEFEVGYVVRGKKSINPMVIRAYSADGTRLRHNEQRYLKDGPKLPKNQVVDLEVKWTTASGRLLLCRVIAQWNSKLKEYVYLVSNLFNKDFRAEDIRNAYKLRWQIELLFKEWKSYANLKKFSTSKAVIAEGLIWAALAAAITKRFIAYATQRSMNVEISTRKIAMCGLHWVRELFHLLIFSTKVALGKFWRQALEKLSFLCPRAHFRRDREKGRLKIGLISAFSY